MQIKPYKRKTQYYETDQMGVIHHSNYIRWFEEARVDFMDQAGYGYAQAVESGIDIAVLGVSCDYKSMVRFGDTVLIQMSIAEMTQTRMTVSYEIRDQQTGELRTLGETRHCFIHRELKRPVSLQKSNPTLFGLFLSLKKD